jgi:uncharacterized protein involved in exopolysaccharide biosynthesis
VDLWQTIKVIGRRWYISLPAFLLGLALVAGAAVTTKHQFESTGTVVLREPSPSEVKGPPAGNPANPMLAFSDSLTTDATLLIQTLNSPAASASVAAQGGTATFTASSGDLAGPFIVIIADALTAGPAQATVTLAFKYANEQLARSEQAAGAPVASYILLDNVVAPTAPALKAGGKSRIAGVALILSVVLSLTVTYAADTYLRRRRRSLNTIDGHRVVADN